MIHLQIIGLTTVETGIFGLIGDLDIQHLTIGITTGTVLTIGIIADRWLNRKEDNHKDK